jgi:hypothetical protein
MVVPRCGAGGGCSCYAQVYRFASGYGSWEWSTPDPGFGRAQGLSAGQRGWLATSGLCAEMPCRSRASVSRSLSVCIIRTSTQSYPPHQSGPRFPSPVADARDANAADNTNSRRFCFKRWSRVLTKSVTCWVRWSGGQGVNARLLLVDVPGKLPRNHSASQIANWTCSPTCGQRILGLGSVTALTVLGRPSTTAVLISVNIPPCRAVPQCP